MVLFRQVSAAIVLHNRKKFYTEKYPKLKAYTCLKDPDH